MYHFPLRESRKRVRMSVFVTVVMIAIDILSVAGVFYLKFYLTRVIDYKNGDVIAEVVNAFQIQLLAAIFSSMGEFISLYFSFSLCFNIVFLILPPTFSFFFSLCLIVLLMIFFSSLF